MKKAALIIFLAFATSVIYNSQVFASHPKKQIITGYSRRAPIRRPTRIIPPPPPRHHYHNHFDFEYNYGTPYYAGYQPVNYIPVYSGAYPPNYYGYPNSHVNMGFRISI